MPKEFNEVQSDEEQVRLETQRFLANFSSEHDVTRAVKALAAVKVKSLEEILRSIESGIVPDNDVEKTFETSVEAAQDYYRTLIRSPGEGSGLMNLDDKAQFLLSLPERLDRAYVRAFDSLYGRFVRFEVGLSSAEKEGKIFSEREQTNLAYFDCMSLLSEVIKKSKRQMLAKRSSRKKRK